MLEKHGLRARSTHHGFTLVEMVLSLAIIGLVAVCVSSVTVLASRAMPSSTDLDVANVTSRELCSRIAGDIASAVTIHAVTANSIDFSVPDRDDNGVNERYTYSWGGNSGDPIVWTYNGSSPQTLVEHARAFHIALGSQSVTVQQTTADAWSNEIVLSRHVGPATAAQDVAFPTARAQHFRPRLPGDATGWNISRVEFQLRRATTATQAPQVQCVVTPISASGVAGLPTQTETQTFTGVTNSTAWVPCTITFNSTPTYDPGTSASIILRQTISMPSSSAFSMAFCDSASESDAYAAWTTNGLTWTTDTDGSYAYAVYGRVRRPATTTVSQNQANRVTVTVHMLNSQPSRVTSRMQNRPVMP